MRLMLLPIDSRPCNTAFVEKLARHAGAECVMPEREKMDLFRRPSRWKDRLAFAKRELPRCDAAVISLDQWCYGSLLASREEDVDPDEAMERISALEELLRQTGDTKVYLNSVLLRTSISVFDASDLALHEAVLEYSQAYDLDDREHSDESAKRLEAAAARLPEKLRLKLHRVRDRNRYVNLSALGLLKRGLVKQLSLLQEDSQPYGLHKLDQRVIAGKLTWQTVGRAFLRNGTDEADAMQAARASLDNAPAVPVDVVWLGDRSFTAIYEDRPFCENLKTGLLEAGLVESSDSDTVICVCCPPDGIQKEAFRYDPDAEYHASCARRIDALAATGKRVYLLDVICANGGAKGLLKSLSDPDTLWGYSAWNTASNSMGTLLAQIVTDALAGKKNEGFFEERIMDDLCYQSHIRAILQEKLTALGENIYALRHPNKAQAMLEKLYEQELNSIWPLRRMPRYRVSLPWPRTFEVEALASG